MTSVPINFYFGIAKLDRLNEELLSSNDSRSKKIEAAQQALSLIRAAFAQARLDNVDLSQLKINVIIRCCERLDNVDRLIFTSSSIESSEQLDQEITLTKRSAVGNWLDAVNRKMKGVREMMQATAEAASAANIDLLKHHRLSFPAGEQLIAVVNQLVHNLNLFCVQLRYLCETPNSILTSLNLYPIDKTLFFQDDLNEFYDTLHGREGVSPIEGIYGTYAKISDSLTVASQQNDPILELFYKPSFLTIDLECMEEDEDGKPRNRFDVLQVYEQMIAGFLTDLRKLLENDRQSPSKVLLAYSALKSYVEARDNYMEDQYESYRTTKSKLRKKIVERREIVKCLERMETTTPEVLQKATKRLRKTEEYLVDLKELFLDLRKLAKKPLYDEVHETLEQVKNHHEYSPYLTYETFDFQVTFNTGHWLIDAVSCSTLNELKQVEAGFKSYDRTIQCFRAILKGIDLPTGALISSFDRLEMAILGANFARNSEIPLT